MKFLNNFWRYPP